VHPLTPSKPPGGLLPVLCLLISASLWGFSWFPLRIAEQAGISGLWIVLLIYGSAAVAGIVIFFKHLQQFSRAPGLLLLMALANAWCNIAFVQAILEGNVVRVILLFYLSPVWTTLLGWLWLGEHLSRLAVVTLVVAMIGAMIMLWDPALGFPWPEDAADWLAISSGMAFSLANVMVRKLQNVSLQLKTLTVWLGVSAIAVLWIALAGLPKPDATVDAFGWTVVIGMTMIVVMTFTVQYGVTHMPVHRSAVILLFELVVATVSAQLLSDEVILPKEWMGGALIMLAAYLSARSFMERVTEEELPGSGGQG
jgi:drug/metabolite transporter (DMT)-like permease